MFRRIMLPSLGRCVTQDGYIEIFQHCVKTGTDVKYEVLKIHVLKYNIKLENTDKFCD